jgi:group I intron endonuclease
MSSIYSIFTIYKATNTINGKVYIGFDSNWPNRIKVHKSASKKQDYKFYRAIRKYGWENFEWSVIYQSKDKQHTLNEMEKYFIKEYNSMKNGYNSTLGGDGCFGNKHTKQTKFNLSEHSKKLWKNSEYRNKTIKSLNKRPKPTKLTKEKQSISLLKTLNKPEHIKLMSEISSNLWQDENYIKKTLDSHKKAVSSQEYRDKMSDIKGKNYKCISPTGEIFHIKNLRKFCKSKCLTATTMIKVAKLKQNQHKGWKCFYD